MDHEVPYVPGVPEADGIPGVFDPRIYAEGIPHARYRLLRDHHPVAWQPEPEIAGWPAGPGFWAVTRHADVVRVLRGHRAYSSWLGATQIRDPDPADLPYLRRTMLNQDPDKDAGDHGRLRRLVSRAFTPARVEAFAERVRERARTLLRAARDGAADGSADLVRTVTDEYALLNLTDLLGIPAADRGLLLDWTVRVIGYQDPEDAPAPLTGPDGKPLNPRSPALLGEMFAYARELADHKRRRPGDDVMTSLALAGLDPAELEMFFFLLTVAGNDTVRSAAPGGLLALARDRDAYRRLADGLVPVDRAVDELLRVHPPVLSFRRTATADTELAGRTVRAGDKVVVFHASANHDERVFTDPARLDLGRTPNPHVSFGDGPHVCLGAHFARLQLRILHEEWRAAAMPAPELTAPPKRLVSNFINGITRLPLRVSGPPR
ncbi:cytochrome P450 [Streptomyces antarcticus]|uniref:cytochrome P450 n=1 Tax=Streptomyces antarcticus TaxID=2996458 RepID=UPI0022706F4A|nr:MULTISPECIES: cytochrome P450 [unclassified Streptomyces]MCY0946224.1 cytochrome P450 [Streptomyces sp. H34-AA3]MCZ4084596.1 cytochrome P450 [Streptomyces sp. H34-S5]